ncbi:uncharacterized protein LOC115756286 [Rhodamnia argentea]|uniref:Uncharacterized protein LOC115756286 n=1 Tax=Rhodamnia argentea TaxID=178133 RepID=A0A8B8R019_9MYRT|nr:uncharacterized protein LOC115756286 [Rhodamnia argentea]
MLAPWEKGKRPAIKTKPKCIVLKKPKPKVAEKSPKVIVPWARQWLEELRHLKELTEKEKTPTNAFSEEDPEEESLEKENLEGEPLNEEVLIEKPYLEGELGRELLEEEPPIDYSSEENPSEESSQDNEDYLDEESDEDN